VADARRREGADVILEPGAPTEALAAAIEAEMLREAQALNFEKAASLRDSLDEIRLQLAAAGARSDAAAARRGRGPSRGEER
jgi:excinuclease UvrABC helicase subunit UvrB